MAHGSTNTQEPTNAQEPSNTEFGPEVFFDNLIGGVRRGSEERALNRNPSEPEDVLGQYARADEAAVREAISAAKSVAAEWADFPAQQRFAILDKAGTLIAERADELADLLAREEENSSPRPVVRFCGQLRSSNSSPAKRSATPERSSTRFALASSRR